MSLPTIEMSPAEAWAATKIAANRVRGRGNTLKAASLAGPTPRTDYIAYMAQLNDAAAVLNAARSTTGIVQYVRDQRDNQLLDVDAEYTSAMNAITTLRDWIFNNFPKNGGGAWLVFTYDSSGAQTALTFSTAALAAFRTNVDTLLAAIS